jgi:hypothetical protein
MTMTRNAKATHSRELATARRTGYTVAEFAAPKLYFPAKAERGHARCTAAEYIEHKMCRGTMNAHRLELVGERRLAAKCRMRRTPPQRPYTGKRRAA